MASVPFTPGTTGPQPQASVIDLQLEQRLAQLANPADANSTADSPIADSSIESGGMASADEDAVQLDTSISQQITRRASEGYDTLSGYFRCSFESQQIRYTLHVPVYPAMKVIPEVEATVVDCESAKVRITDRQKFGLRMEVILAHPSPDPQSVLVELTAFSNLETSSNELT